MDNDIVANITNASEIIKSEFPLIQFSSSIYENGQQIYFLGSSNGMFEIFDSNKRIFICKENIKLQPSLLTNSEYDVDNLRCFTDLTQPMVNLSRFDIEGFKLCSVKEIYFHSFGGSNMYVFAVLHNGRIHAYKQVI